MTIEQIRSKNAITKEQFHAMLRRWIVETNDERVGPEEIRGQTPWVHIRVGSIMFALNADTRYAAVEKYLQLVSLHGDDITWEIVPSQRGNMTAVVYGPEQIRYKPFYLYARP